MKDLSIILIDWGVRERFHALDWLAQQTVPREKYELIWVEWGSRVVPVVKDKADHFLALGKSGLYHKHEAINAGLAQSTGRIVTMCDSDAVFPAEFVESVIGAFAERKVLMHHEHRSNESYPDGATLDEIKAKPFVDLIPNTSACTSMLRRDAIGFGGVDEHESYRGILSGQFELVWRLINSGVSEVWHDSVYIYHFDHPGGSGRGQSNTERAPDSHELDMHNLTGVEGFRSGRLLPLVENSKIHQLRMEQRIIGTEFEKQYSV